MGRGEYRAGAGIGAIEGEAEAAANGGGGIPLPLPPYIDGGDNNDVEAGEDADADAAYEDTAAGDAVA